MTAPTCACVPWLRMIVVEKQVAWECDRCGGRGELLLLSEYDAASRAAQEHQRACETNPPSEKERVDQVVREQMAVVGSSSSPQERTRALYRAADACADSDLSTAIKLRHFAGEIERGLA